MLTPIEYASIENESHILKVLINTTQKSRQRNFEEFKLNYAKILKYIPDYSIDMCFNCDPSSIPFIPSDIYRIHKQGDKLRVDFSVLGWNCLKGVNGELSLIFNGKTGDLYLCDNITKKASNVFLDISKNSIKAEVDELILRWGYQGMIIDRKSVV